MRSLGIVGLIAALAAVGVLLGILIKQYFLDPPHIVVVEVPFSQLPLQPVAPSTIPAREKDTTSAPASRPRTRPARPIKSSSRELNYIKQDTWRSRVGEILDRYQVSHDSLSADDWNALMRISSKPVQSIEEILSLYRRRMTELARSLHDKTAYEEYNQSQWTSNPRALSERMQPRTPEERIHVEYSGDLVRVYRVNCGEDALLDSLVSERDLLYHDLSREVASYLRAHGILR